MPLVDKIEALEENSYGFYWDNGIMYFSRPQQSSKNNPIMYYDPSGHFVITLGFIIKVVLVVFVVNNSCRPIYHTSD